VINGQTYPPVFVRAQALVDLLSTVQRPFLWSVLVWGEPPFAHRRRYEICAPTEKEAAQSGLHRFEFEMAMKSRH
jgi:hypothetical protein